MIAAPGPLACRGMKPSVRPREWHVDAETKAGPDTALPKLRVAPLGPRQWDRGTGRDILPPMTWCSTIAAGPMCAQLYGGTSLERRGHPAAVFSPGALYTLLLWCTQTKGESERSPTSGRKCYITPAFLGVPKQGDKVKGGPQVGRIATSPLRSWGSPNKGTKSKVAHKWAEVLHRPCVLTGPQTRGQSQRWPTSGRNTSRLGSWGSPNKGTKSKVAHKRAEVLHHPCVLGGPQTRGQSQRWPTSGQNCYITPAFSGVPKQGDKVKGVPQVGRIATSRLPSWGCPSKGTKSKVAHKWAKLLHHPCVLGGPQTREQSQRWPTSGQNCYITPAFLVVPKQGGKVKGPPQVGTIATSPVPSWGSPNKGTK